MAFGIVAGQSVDLSPIDKKENDWELILTHTEHFEKGTPSKRITFSEPLNITSLPKFIKCELNLKGTSEQEYQSDGSPYFSISLGTGSYTFAQVEMRFDDSGAKRVVDLYSEIQSIGVNSKHSRSGVEGILRTVNEATYYASYYKDSSSPFLQKIEITDIREVVEDNNFILNEYLELQCSNSTDYSWITNINLDATFNLYGKF